MPGGDRTGPAGKGPMSGRGTGYCAGYDVPGYANPWPGRGAGFGYEYGWRWGGGRGAGYDRGRGWGARWRYPGPDIPCRERNYTRALEEEEERWLQEEAEALERELCEIRQRIDALKSSETEES